MHAVVVTVTIEPGHTEEAQAQLDTDVVPMVKQTPGVIAGYWLARPDGQHGLSVVLLESEEAARAAADRVPNAPTPDFVTFDSVEVCPVVASF